MLFAKMGGGGGTEPGWKYGDPVVLKFTLTSEMAGGGGYNISLLQDKYGRTYAINGYASDQFPITPVSPKITNTIITDPETCPLLSGIDLYYSASSTPTQLQLSLNLMQMIMDRYVAGTMPLVLNPTSGTIVKINGSVVNILNTDDYWYKSTNVECSLTVGVEYTLEITGYAYGTYDPETGGDIKIDDTMASLIKVVTYPLSIPPADTTRLGTFCGFVFKNDLSDIYGPGSYAALMMGDVDGPNYDYCLGGQGSNTPLVYISSGQGNLYMRYNIPNLFVADGFTFGKLYIGDGITATISAQSLKLKYEDIIISFTIDPDTGQHVPDNSTNWEYVLEQMTVLAEDPTGMPENIYKELEIYDIVWQDPIG